MSKEGSDIFQLNVFKPVIIKNVLQSIRLLSDGKVLFDDSISIYLTSLQRRVRSQRTVLLVSRRTRSASTLFYTSHSCWRPSLTATLDMIVCVESYLMD